MFDSEKICEWLDIIRPHLEYGMTHTSLALYLWALKNHGYVSFSLREKTSIGQEIFPYMGKAQGRAVVSRSAKKLVEIGYAKLNGNIFCLLERPNRKKVVFEPKPILVYPEETAPEVKKLDKTSLEWRTRNKRKKEEMRNVR